MFWTKNTMSVWSLFVKTAAFSLATFGLFFALGVSNVKAQPSTLTEGFEVVPVPGWFTQNNSVPVGTTGWFQGNTAVFSAQAGTPASYIGSNFNATTGANTISNWLVTPQLTLVNGAVIKFWTRTTTANPFPDRLQVRLSTAGASTNVGTGSAETAVGVFTTKLLDINETYGSDYPEVWQEQTITLTNIPAGATGRIAFRYFVEDGGPGGDNSNFIGIDTFSYTASTPPTAPGDAPVDLNGDGRTDYTVVRNTGGGSGGAVTWFYNLNTAANTPATVAFRWGISTDFFLSEDFDNDNKDDITVWRAGAPTVAAFYIYNSATNTVRVEPFGQTGDDPTIVDDYNGDGSADLAVYRGGAGAGAQSTWFYRTTPNGAVTFVPWGTSGDFPIPGDFDGNGSADFTVQRGVSGEGRYFTRLSTGAVSVVGFGLPTDLVVPGDYDGDGKTDYAVVRSSGGSLNWYWRRSSDSAIVGPVIFGASATDSVAQGDYDGDGRTDVAVWRSGTFYTRSTVGSAVTIFALGAAGDFPVANYNSH